MQSEQKQFLEKRFEANEWRRRGTRGRRVIKDFEVDGSEIPGWTLHRIRSDENAKSTTVRSMWRHGESTDELLEIDIFLCASVKAAHDQLIEALGNFEGDVIKRRTEKSAVGDVSFGLANTMILFARANLVILIRNAGPKVVGVGSVARELDALLTRWGKPDRSR